VAVGGAYTFNDMVTCNAGALYTQFVLETNQYDHTFANGIIEADPIRYHRSHAKNAIIFAIGVDLSLTNGTSKRNGNKQKQAQ
jgi:hypothetical protein